MPEQYKVLLIGSSYVNRLKGDIRARANPAFKDNFGLDHVHVDFLCRGGWRLHDIEAHLDLIVAKAPNIIFIQCGANDISVSQPLRYGEAVADRLLEIAKDIKKRTGAEIAIGPCLERRVGRYIHSHDQADAYNQQATRANCFLKVVASEVGVVYWRHRGLSNWQESGLEDVIGRDGVHLSHRGQYKFYKSLKGAIVHLRNRQRRSLV